jgi:hypothetical protein
MNISTNINANAQTQEIKSTNIQTNFTQKISSDKASEIRAQIAQNAHTMVLKSVNLQTSVSSAKDGFKQTYKDFQSFLSDIGYNGKPIADLSKSEATDLISEDGIFGVAQTSQRIADFVINGANGNEDMFRAGKKGMMQGFKEAQDMWGGKLPEISQETMKKAIEMVDAAMSDAGFAILDKEV